MEDFDICDDDFRSFLARSSPPLQALDIMGPHLWPADTRGQVMKDWAYFRLVLSLTDLILSFQKGSISELPFLHMITGQDLLPNLRNLTITGRVPEQGSERAAMYENLMQMLSARRTSNNHHTQLQSFNLFSDVNDVRDKLNDGVVMQLRQLAEDGLRIRVGDKNTNLI